jgi:hypothetical protein
MMHQRILLALTAFLVLPALADEFVGIKADESEGVLVVQERQMNRTDDEALRLYELLALPEMDLGGSKFEKSYVSPAMDFEMRCQKNTGFVRMGNCQVILRKSARVELVASQREMNFIASDQEVQELTKIFKAGPTLRFKSRSGRVQFLIDSTSFRMKASQKLIGRPPGP